MQADTDTIVIKGGMFLGMTRNPGARTIEINSFEHTHTHTDSQILEASEEQKQSIINIVGKRKLENSSSHGIVYNLRL